MPRRLDVGLASFGSPALLHQTIASFVHNSVTNWHLIIINNPHPDPKVQAAVNDVLAQWFGGWYTGRITILSPNENVGYAGAVKLFQQVAKSEYLAYIDNDVVLSLGWDERLCSYLDKFHEAGIVFPNGGPYSINRGPYTEVLWGVGFCWVLSRLCMSEVGYFDDSIGHQQEADYSLRVRMAGWKCIAAPEVRVQHLATATNDPESTERIAKGVREFVNKWTSRLCGKNINYHSPNVCRWHDWHANSLYLEEWFKINCPDVAKRNENPETVNINGEEFDLLLVPRLKGFYRGRVI